MAGRAEPPRTSTAVASAPTSSAPDTSQCSDPLLNQFHENVVWGMRGNFLDVPTDCPQRDERLGWTGDIAAFAPTAAFLYDVDALPPRLAASTLRWSRARTTGSSPTSSPTC